MAALAAVRVAHAADRTAPGTGNTAAAAVAGGSPLVQSALQRLRWAVATVSDRGLRERTVDAPFNPGTCVFHRAELTAAAKRATLAQLQAAGLYASADAAAFPGGALAGVFPPVQNDGSACPHLPQGFGPQGFGTAPGSNFGSHHSYPGGLAVHEGFNTASALSFVANYELAYGLPGSGELPRMATVPTPPIGAEGDLDISRDEVVAAPPWHDWAKTLVFQWNADGTELAEFNFGGNGSTDDYGAAGDSRTGGHHILSLAEAIARNLPAPSVIVQACAHSATTLGNECKVVNWLRTAAIIAQADPVARGLLVKDASGQLRLPPLRAGGTIDLNAAGQVNLSVEETIHNLSDADFVLSIPAVTEAQVILQTLVLRYGYDPVADAARYTVRFRNTVLSFLSAERLLVLYGTRGLDAVRTELDALRSRQVI